MSREPLLLKQRGGIMSIEYDIHLPLPHPKQDQFIHGSAKRIICRSGRRSGKTVGVSILAVERFLAGKRILYATPTADQIGRFWTTITRSLYEPIKAGVFYKNETEHIIELPGTEQRIRAKTAFNADTLRGDYADELILDEWQLMSEDAWETVGAPMMLDSNGNATFIYTPPSLHSRSMSKANDPQHAAKMYKKFKALMDAGNPRYFATTFTSHENPYISKDALSEITSDMTALAYRMEILAEDIDEAPGALWTRATIDKFRVGQVPEIDVADDDGKITKQQDLARIVIGVDPSGSARGDACGIIAVGLAHNQIYVLRDTSIQASPHTWATSVINSYYKYMADAIIAEGNYGGEMVKEVIWGIDPKVNVRMVHATHGKAIRAEPVAAIYENGRAHHVGSFPLLEDEMCMWIPGDASPNRMDAMVWAATDLLKLGVGVEAVENPFYA